MLKLQRELPETINRLELLDMYFMYRYEDMVEKIKSFTGKGQATRNACLKCLNTIIEEG